MTNLVRTTRFWNSPLLWRINGPWYLRLYYYHWVDTSSGSLHAKFSYLVHCVYSDFALYILETDSIVLLLRCCLSFGARMINE